jgi:protein-tyrosine phosphatase
MVNMGNPTPPARIDLHSHLLPGLDDGCRSLDESIYCVQRLMECGFVGSVCTPHLWPEAFPENTPEQIGRAVAELREHIHLSGLNYQLWTGGELRIADTTLGWLDEVGVPTLGTSRCVLMDYWGERWPGYADELCLKLLERGYQPILAHPERMGLEESDLERLLLDLEHMGVWFQGNFNCMTGGEGRTAARWVRRLLNEARYFAMALDMHRPETLESRLEGLMLIEAEWGEETLRHLIEVQPRKVLLEG